MSIDVILQRLNKVRQSGDTYRAQCPCNHKSEGQLSLREVDGRILIHCHAGHSPTEIMEALDLSLSDLFEKPLDSHIRPLYMAQKEKREQDGVEDRIKACDLRLELAAEMRSSGIKLSPADIKAEKEAFIEKKRLQANLQ